MRGDRRDKPRGPVLVWIASGLTLAAGMLYLVLADPAAGEGRSVLAMGGILLLSGLASAAAGWTSSRRGARWLLIVALMPPLAMGILAILSIGILFLAVAGVISAALVQTAREPAHDLVTEPLGGHGD